MNKYVLCLFTFLALIIIPVYANESRQLASIIQQGISYPLLQENMKIVLSKRMFSIMLLTKRNTKKESNAIKIAAFTDSASLDKIKIGSKIEETPYFAEGTGMAADKEGYSSIFLNNEGHHYIYYTNEDDKRASLIFQREDILLLELDLHSFYLSNKDTEFKDANVQRFFMVIFNDTNNNAIVDEGELNKITIDFEG